MDPRLHWLVAISPAPSFTAANPICPWIYRRGAQNVHFDFLVTALEFPPIDAVVSDSDSNAAMSLQIVRMDRCSEPFEIGWGTDDEPADVGGESLSDHVLRDSAAVSDASIETAFHHVDHPVVHRKLDLDVGIPIEKRGHDRSDEKLRRFGRHA
jgi:hypothetical protein